MKKFFFSMLLIIFVFVYLWQHFSVVSMGYEIEKLQKEKEQQIDLTKKLIVSEERLKSLDRIERIARLQLHMDKPEEGQIIIVHNNTQLNNNLSKWGNTGNELIAKRELDINNKINKGK